MKMRGTTAAYLAGYFDGEGCIIIARQARKRPDGTPYYTHELRLSIGTTDPRVITEFRDTFGGRIQFYEKKDPRHSSVYQWAIHSRRAIKALDVMYKYLRTKKSDADIARAFKDICGTQGHGIAITPDVYAQREGFRLRLMENHGTASRQASAKKSWDDRHSASVAEDQAAADTAWQDHTAAEQAG